MKLILASASPRRQELLSRMVKNFDIIASNYDETKVKFTGDCAEYVINIAKGKALAVVDKFHDERIVIGCDTVVFLNGEILGKPENEKDAYNMLKSLSDSTHEVYTGITLINTLSKETSTDYCCTKVTFSHLDDYQINDYIKSREPMDKAGAYGIQGLGGVFVEKIDGCYFNVVGLPLNKMYFMLRGMGVNL